MSFQFGVFGLARSGLSTLRAFPESVIYAWDDKDDHRHNAQALALSNVHLFPFQDWPTDLDFIVLSPGIPLTHPAPHPIVAWAQRHDIELICDIELFYRLHPDCTIVGVTGTNGKSTVCSLLNHCLQMAGKKSFLAGNIGVPVFDAPILHAQEILVLEISSFQLDLCPSFVPHIGLFLNIQPHHLERHGDMDQYFAIKTKILKNKKAADFALLGVDDTRLNDYYQPNKHIAVRYQDYQGDLPPHLSGDHNRQNIAFVMRVLDILGVSFQTSYLFSYAGLPHRQFLVRDDARLKIINDSKATSTTAAAKALEACDDYPVLWICGGMQQVESKEPLIAGLKNVKKAYVIGESSAIWITWLQEQGVDCVACDTLEKAVKIIADDVRDVKDKHTILLSPACPSWDQFTSFEQRGDLFIHYLQEFLR
jgi:UDP-N-acetylmuramoylalanine--D-glutamate ligase